LAYIICDIFLRDVLLKMHRNPQLVSWCESTGSWWSRDICGAGGS